jgi:hypothetical protein
MWSLLTNPIITHLLSLAAGAGGAWYLTHKTAAHTAGVAIESAVKAVGEVVKGA